MKSYRITLNDGQLLSAHPCFWRPMDPEWFVKYTNRVTPEGISTDPVTLSNELECSKVLPPGGLGTWNIVVIALGMLKVEWVATAYDMGNPLGTQRGVYISNAAHTVETVEPIIIPGNMEGQKDWGHRAKTLKLNVQIGGDGVLASFSAHAADRGRINLVPYSPFPVPDLTVEMEGNSEASRTYQIMELEG